MGNRWEELAQLDPLFVVLSDKEKEHGRWEPDAFFRTGRDEVGACLDRLADLGGRLPAEGQMLDFGCGVGRLTQALADRGGRAVGIDISPRMIELAREFAEAREDCEFVLNEAPDLSVLEDARFDLVFTSKVLFHVKPELQLTFLREFFRVLKPGGFLVFGASVFAPAPTRWRAFHARYKTIRRRVLHKQVRFKAARALGFKPKWLYEKFGWRPMMPMYTVEEARIQAVVDDCGGETLGVDKELRRHRMNAMWFVRKGGGTS